MRPLSQRKMCSLVVITLLVAFPAVAPAGQIDQAALASSPLGAHQVTVGKMHRQTISGRFISPSAQLAAAQAELRRQAQATSLGASSSTSTALRVVPFRSGPNYATAKSLASTSPIAPRVRSPGAASVSAVFAGTAPLNSLARAFDGMADSGFICGTRGCTPPDMALATSPQYVLQAVNTSVAVFSTGGVMAPGYPLKADTFLGGLPNNIISRCNPSGPLLSDPRAFYDPNDQRFFVALIQYDGPANGGSPTCPNLGLVWIAASVDANPAHGWYVYSYDGSDGYQNGPDYPSLGFDASTVEISTNQFSNTTGGYVSAEATFLDKAALETGAAPLIQTFNGLAIDNQQIDTAQPVETQAPLSKQPGVIFNLASQNIFFGQGCFLTQCNKVAIFGVLEPLSVHPQLIVTVATTPPYVVPPNADTGFCSNCLETIDTRISATPVFSAIDGGTISWALGTAIGNATQVVSGVLWGEFKAALGKGRSSIVASTAQAGYIAGSGDLANSFPATAIGADGSVFIVDDRMGRTTAPGNAVYVHHRNDAPGTVGSPTTIKAGVAPPVADLPFLFPNIRYGDYSATSFDGSNVWVAAQYINGGGDWATSIAAPR